MIIFESTPNSAIAKIDPRVRVLLAMILAAVVCVSSYWPVLVLASVAAVLTVLAAGMSVKKVVKRLRAINLLMFFLLILLPLSWPGVAMFKLGPLAWSYEGISRVLLIAWRANVIMIMLAGLIATMEPSTLGAALDRLFVPHRLTHVLLFMVRYIEVIHQEYHRLRNAMRLRGFHPKCDLHTLRTFGYLIGMLLVRSLDRSERIIAAMKCRGFTGRFYILHPFAMTKVDTIVLAAGLVLSAAMIWMELRWPIA